MVCIRFLKSGGEKAIVTSLAGKGSRRPRRYRRHNNPQKEMKHSTTPLREWLEPGQEGRRQVTL